MNDVYYLIDSGLSNIRKICDFYNMNLIKSININSNVFLGGFIVISIKPCLIIIYIWFHLIVIIQKIGILQMLLE
jgi:hypothetical protein